MNTPKSQTVQFEVFEVDLATGQLRKAGTKIKLQDQPFQILSALLERPGEIVSREDLRAIGHALNVNEMRPKADRAGSGSEGGGRGRGSRW